MRGCVSLIADVQNLIRKVQVVESICNSTHSFQTYFYLISVLFSFDLQVTYFLEILIDDFCHFVILHLNFSRVSIRLNFE